MIQQGQGRGMLALWAEAHGGAWRHPISDFVGKQPGLWSTLDQSTPFSM